MEETMPPGLADLLELHQNCFVTETEPLPPAELYHTGKQLDELKRRRNSEYRHFLRDICVPMWQQSQTSTLTGDHSEEWANEVKNKIKKLQEDFGNLYHSFQPSRSSSNEESPTGIQDGDRPAETKSGRYFPCLFYPSFWFPDKTRITCKIEVQNSKVKINDTIVEFEAGTVSYLERYYSNGDGVHRVPPVMFHKDRLRLEVKEPMDQGQEITEVERENAYEFHHSKGNVERNVGGKSKGGRSQNFSKLATQCEYSVVGRGIISSVRAASNESESDSHRREAITEEGSRHMHPRPSKELGKQEKKQKKKFVSKINLMTDDDVKNANNEILKKLSENQRKEIMRTRKSDRAVDKVANNFEIFAREEKLHTIILTDFKYKSYLQNVVRKKNQFISNISGDHDLMVICKEVGIIFIQVKSNVPQNTASIPKDVSYALRQLLSDKYSFWQSNRDLHFIKQLPIYCFIAVPFLTDSCLKAFNICPSHKALIMSNSVCKTSESLSSWLKDKIRIPRDPIFEDGQYRILIARYIGQGSIKVLPNPVKTTAEQIDRVFLNPDQHALLQDPVNKLQMIAGNYGTGKTLLLTFLADKIRKNNPNAKLHCITCSDVSKEGLCNPSSPFQASHQMSNFLGNITRAKAFGEIYKTANNSQKTPPFIFVTSKVFFDTLSKLMTLSSDGEEQHFLVDEAPLILFERSENSDGPLNDFLESLSPGTYVWISIASHTYKVDVGKGEDPAGKAKVNIHPKFNFRYLKYTMRVCRRLFNMVQEVEAFTQDGHHRYSECGHVIDGSIPRLYTLGSCTCEPPTRQAGTLPCDCSKTRLTDLFEKIFYFVKANYKKDIVVLIEYGIQGSFYTKLCEIVDAVLQNQKKKWLLAFKSVVDDQVGQSSTENPNEVIMVADGRTFRGCENRIVIVVDPYRMSQWFQTHGHVGVPTMVLTRCLGQYIHVTWPEEESSVMCSHVLDAYDDLIDKYQFMPKSWQDHMREFVRQARASERSILINTLVERGLLLDCSDN